jgi:hypothetical protein
MLKYTFSIKKCSQLYVHLWFLVSHFLSPSLKLLCYSNTLILNCMQFWTIQTFQ